MKSMDMPLTFDELGVESTDENLKILEDYLIDSPYVEKSEESYACLHEAMRPDALIERLFIEKESGYAELCLAYLGSFFNICRMSLQSQ